MGGDRAFLFGRRTYEQLLASWNAQGGPFQDALNNTQKYVASHSPATRLEWPNSTLLDGDVPAAVAELKQASSGNLVIMGSGEFIAALMAADLIDEYLLMIHPLVLGTGCRLFPEGGRASLRLTDSVITTKGVLMATYELDSDKNRENPFRSAAGNREYVPQPRRPRREEPDHEAIRAQHLPARRRPAASDVLEKVMDNMRAVDEQIHAAGAWVFTGGLHEPSTAIVLSPRARRCR
jgi:dihydrofolate reductase